MNKAKEPTKEEMLAYHEGMIDTWHPKAKQCHEAIRKLIEKFFEWQEKAKGDEHYNTEMEERKYKGIF